MTRPVPALYGAPVIGADETVPGIGRRLTGIVLDPPAGPGRRLALAAGLLLLGILLAALVLPPAGLGSGDDVAVVLATDAAAYDWWIGAAGGSLLVAGVLLLAGTAWRGAVGRIAETVALLCAIAAWLHPLLHLDRPSILHRDAAGLFTLLVACASLWWIGLLPDLAALRDRARERAAELAAEPTGAVEAGRWRLRARLYALLAVGWRGAAVQWQRRGEAYRTVALLACLLVIVLRAGAALVPAASALPGGPDTLMPVTLLVGAVLAGCGLTAMVAVAVRAACRLEGLITARHLDILARTILALGLAGLYCHVTALFAGLLHGDPAASEASVSDGVPPLRVAALAGLLPAQVFWLPRARRSALAVGLVGGFVALGTYADHMILTILGLRDALPDPDPAATVALRAATTLAGAAGLFLLLLLLILRVLPLVSIAATRTLALVHNPDAACAQAPPGDGPGPRAGRDRRDGAALPRAVGAAFASEDALAAAIRALAGSPGRLDAYGPVPMPAVCEALHLPAHRLRRAALAGTAAGALGFLALRLRPEAWSTTWPTTWPATWQAAWPSDWPSAWKERIDLADPLASLAAVLLPAGWPALAVSGLAAALTAGTLAVHLALLLGLARPGRQEADLQADVQAELRGFLRTGRDGYLLVAAFPVRLSSEPGGGAGAERLAGRLAALPPESGRPVAIRRFAR